MIGIEKPKIETEGITPDGTYGKFIVEPLERGYGTTLGNSLRRVLLSALPTEASLAWAPIVSPPRSLTRAAPWDWRNSPPPRGWSTATRTSARSESLPRGVRREILGEVNVKETP